MAEISEDSQTEEPKKTPWVMAEPKEVGEPQRNFLGLLVILGLFAALFLFTSAKMIVVVLGVLISIVLHELGHFMTARWTGMKATQFFIFMGPRIWSFKRGETEYGVRSLPLGAFVRIVGMNNLDPCDPEDEPRAYKNKSYPRRMLVITAGSMMHFIQATLILVALVSVVGITEAVTESSWTVSEFPERDEDSSLGAAELAGIEGGDNILFVDDVDASLFADLGEYVKDRPGEDVEIQYSRDGQLATTVATLNSRDVEDENGKTSTVGMLCIGADFSEHVTTRSNPVNGVIAFGRIAYGSVVGLKEAPSAYGQAVSKILEPEEVPVDTIAAGCSGISSEANRPMSALGFVRAAGQTADWQTVAFLLAGFNIILGIFNLVPLLPLDGGHAAIATYERFRSRKNKPYHADVNKLVPLTYLVMFLLLALTVPLIILDIVRPIVIG